MGRTASPIDITEELAVQATVTGIQAEFGPDNVSVNCVGPGPVNTAAWDQLATRVGGVNPDGNQRARQARAAQIPMGRFADRKKSPRPSPYETRLSRNETLRWSNVKGPGR